MPRCLITRLVRVTCACASNLDTIHCTYQCSAFVAQAPVARGEAGAEEVQAEGLLQDPGRGAERQRRGDQEGLPEAGHGSPSGQAFRGNRAGEEGPRTQVQRGQDF
jgi:hypothetical protein